MHMTSSPLTPLGAPSCVRVDTMTGPRTMIFPQILDVREDSAGCFDRRGPPTPSFLPAFSASRRRRSARFVLEIG